MVLWVVFDSTSRKIMAKHVPQARVKRAADECTDHFSSCEEH